MVIGQRDDHYRSNDDLPVDNDGPIFDSVHACESEKQDATLSSWGTNMAFEKT
jgi:hypothetical protein